MYNGIGLQTPRGSGTNGYVQRNMSFVAKSREKVNYRTEEDIKKLDALANKKPNQGILAHERKRLIELKCYEMQELMEDQGYPADEIESKVALFRTMLLEKDGGEKEIPKDEFGRPIVKESHQIAEANQEKNMKMREALGISQYFVEGSSLDPDRKAKEAAAAAAEEAKKKYTLIPDSSSSSSPERANEKEKKKKKKTSHSSHEIEVASSSKKKKSSKKHRKDRSISPEFRKKKKVKKSGKDKSKRKSKYEESHKEHHNARSSSSSSSSSNSADDESSSRSSSRSSLSNIDSVPSHKKHKSTKQNKSHKGHRKRSSSSESILYSKESRSRKDIYEAKKEKRKRRSNRSSSSEADSSPKQYFRLEPVILKSKSKHSKTCHVIEVPKGSALGLKKVEKKRRVWDSPSSSSDDKFAKHDNKRRKYSPSPRSSKHHSTRTDFKRTDSEKSSKKRDRDSSSPKEKSKHKRSRSSSSQRKSHFHKKTVVIEDVNIPRKVKDKHDKNTDAKYDLETKKKHSRRIAESPKKHNGHHRHSITPDRSSSFESDSSIPSKKSASHYKHKKHLTKSPSCSPPHIPSSSKLKYASKISPPKTNSSKTTKYRSSSRSITPQKTSRKHKSHTKSYSPDQSYENQSRDSKNNYTKTTDKNMGKKRVRRSESRSVSPSCYLNSKLSSRKVRSHSGSSDSENEFNSLNQKKNKEKLIMNSLKSKSEQKELNFITTSSYNSPDYKKDISKKKSNKSKLDETVIRKDDNNDNSDFEHRSADSDKSNGKNSGITPEKTSKKSRSPKDEDYSKRYAQEKALSRNSDAFFENKSIPLSSKSSSKFDESSKSSNICPTLVQKNYLNSSGQIKSKWNVVTNLNESKRLCDDNHSTSNEHLSESSKDILKINDKVLPLANASPSNELEKEIHRTSRNDHETLVSTASLNKNEGTTDQNTEARKNETVKHLVERKRSRSRSSSPGGSCSPSASDRSSRSRSRSHSSRRSQSYSKSRSKSYSKSRSKSYSKSRSPSRSKSHSKSRSRSHTKSCSKSYSRSRSVSLDSRSRSRSYSSRSRSRSIARSPSIPRRRGSPSFLDKRRITRARSVSAPRSKRRASSKGSRLYSRSQSRSSFSCHSSTSSTSDSRWSQVYRLH